MQKSTGTLIRALALSFSLGLAACGGGGKEEKAAAAAAAVSAAVAATPADPALAQVYDTSCKSCHTNPAAGAPLAGNAQAWAPRIAQGKDTLLDHTINGYLGMPPMGMCIQCSEDDFQALIEFMSGAKLD
jgi:cytochrome c5